jgi:putative redox protein
MEIVNLPYKKESIMADKIVAKHNGGLSFETVIGGHTITVDADPAFGGMDKGPKPKPLLLQALAGCTGIDVVSLLKKMRVKYSDFSITVEAELTEEHPKYYHKIHLVYSIKAKPVYHERIDKAVNLSQERYCGVSFMLSKSSELTHEIKYV